MTSRILRRTGAAAVAAALAFSLSACGSDEPKRTNIAVQPVPIGATEVDPSATPSPEPSYGAPQITEPPVVDPNATTGPTDRPDLFGEQKPFTGEAADKFGADNVMAAYKHLVTFHNENGYVTSLMKPRAKTSDFKPVEFSFLKPYMTESMQADWDKTVAAALAGDYEAIGSVMALTLFDIGGETTGPKYTVFDDQPTLGQTFTAAKSSVDGDRLILEFRFTKDLRVMHEGKKILLPYHMDQAWTVVPNGNPEIPWLIDGYRIVHQAGDPIPMED